MLKRSTTTENKIKKCSCGSFNDRHPARYCTECHSKYMREWRKTHKLNPVQTLKDRCRSYAGSYLRRGKIKKQPCIRCGSKDVIMHWKDYNKPLEIDWLCKRDHRIVIAELRKEGKKEKILFAVRSFNPPIL